MNLKLLHDFRRSRANIAMPLETVTLKMNQKALLVHFLLETGTVEKQCGGKGKAFV